MDPDPTIWTKKFVQFCNFVFEKVKIIVDLRVVPVNTYRYRNLLDKSSCIIFTWSCFGSDLYLVPSPESDPESFEKGDPDPE